MGCGKMKITNATLGEVDDIHDLIYKNAMKGLMLYRTKEEIAYHIRDYFVRYEKGKAIGCVGLKVWDKNSGEIYALAVDPKYTGKGIGRTLVKACIKEAENIKLPRIFALTYRQEMFLKLGFKKLTLRDLPKKIFTEKTVNVDRAYGMKLT